MLNRELANRFVDAVDRMVDDSVKASNNLRDCKVTKVIIEMESGAEFEVHVVRQADGPPTLVEFYSRDDEEYHTFIPVGHDRSSKTAVGY